MADILIRKIDPATKELLQQRAARRGKSLEADLRETLEILAGEEAETSKVLPPFGTWLVEMSRPGFDDFADAVEEIRNAPFRPVSFD